MSCVEFSRPRRGSIWTKALAATPLSLSWARPGGEPRLSRAVSGSELRAVDVGASSAVPLLWHETREKSPVISVVSHSPQNHLALEEPSAVLPSCVGLVEGVGPGTGFRVVRTGVLKAGETRAVTQTEVKAGVLWGTWVREGGLMGIQRPTMPWWDACVGLSACMCLLFIAMCSAFYKENSCLVRPPPQPRPSMTLNILSRQTSDPSPKISLTLTPVSPPIQFLAPG